MTAYTIVNEWQGPRASDELPWQVITESFTVDGVPWALVWSVRGAELKVKVNHADGRPPVFIQVVGDVPGGAQGVNYLFDSGTFNLEIDGQGQWTVKLVAISDLVDESPELP